MNKVFNFFIKRSFQVNLISVFFIIFGILALTKIPVQLFPNTDQNRIYMRISHRDYNVFQMESELTYPIEERLLNLPEVKSVSTTSKKRRVTFWIKLKRIQDKEKLQEELQKIAQEFSSKLPNGMQDISFDRFWSSQNLGNLMVQGADFEKDADRKEVTRITSKIAKIKGISSIEKDIPQRNIYINLNSKKLHFYQTSIRKIKSSLIEAFSTYPMGSVKQNGKKVFISLENQVNNIDEIKQISLSVKDGQNIQLQDISEVKFMRAPRTRATLINGKISKWYDITGSEDANIIETNDLIRDFIKKYNKKDKSITLDFIWATDLFLRSQVDLLKNNAGLGFILVFICLLCFLSFKLALSVLFGIPVVYCISFIMIQYFGIKIDLVSITAMILVIGILVDDAIIVAEKYIFELEAGLSPDNAIQKTISDTFFPITGSILTTIIAFYPIAYDKAGTQSFFWGFFMIILFSLFASWFESFFILPNHLHHWVKKANKSENSKWSNIFKRYEFFLRKAIQFRYVAILFIIGFIALTIMVPGKKMKPSFSFSMSTPRIHTNFIFKQQKSVEEFKTDMQPLVSYLEDLKSKKEIEGYFMMWGSKGSWRNRLMGKQYGNMRVLFSASKPKLKEHVKKHKDKLESYIKQIKIKNLESFDFIDGKTRLEEQEDLMEVEISGSDQFNQKIFYKKLSKLLSPLEEVKEVLWPESNQEEMIQFKPNTKALKEHGVSFSQLNQQTRPYLSYNRLKEIRYSGEKSYLYLGVNDPFENQLYQQQSIKVLNANNILVPLEIFGHWENIKTIKEIKHWNMNRIFKLYIRYDNTKYTDREKLGKDWDKKIDSLRKEYPKESIHLKYLNENQKQNKDHLLESILMTLALVLLTLMLTMQSLVLPFFVISAIPFGMMGVAWALYFHGLKVEFVGLVGLIGMCGIVVNDSLLMIDAMKRYMNEGLNATQAVIKGASSRLRAIILTTITTLCGIFPLMYGIGGDAGYTKPLIFSLGWGILSSTIMILIFLPPTVAIFYDIKNFLMRKIK